MCDLPIHLFYPQEGPEDKNALGSRVPASPKSNFMSDFHKSMMQLDAVSMGPLILMEKERYQSRRS